jgi:hypothetical protein
MHRNLSMDLRRPMPEINRIPKLANPGKTSRFVQDSKEIFREVEILKVALVHSQITSVADLDEISVIAYSLRQALGGSLISEVVE